MRLQALPARHVDSENFVRYSVHIFALAPNPEEWQDDDSDADWEARDPADAELHDAEDDVDWWLDDESDDEPLPDDWRDDERNDD